MLDWLHFHFNLCPISYVATDLISSQYSDCVFSSLHPDAHQMVTVELGPVASLTSFLCMSLGNQNVSMSLCHNFPQLLSLRGWKAGLAPRVAGVRAGPGPLVAGVSSEPGHQSESASQSERRQQAAVRGTGIKCLGTVSDQWFFEICRKIFPTLLLV